MHSVHSWVRALCAVQVTKYLIVVIGKDQADVTVAFGITSITAPIVGTRLGLDPPALSPMRPS